VDHLECQPQWATEDIHKVQSPTPTTKVLAPNPAWTTSAVPCPEQSTTYAPTASQAKAPKAAAHLTTKITPADALAQHSARTLAATHLPQVKVEAQHQAQNTVATPPLHSKEVAAQQVPQTATVATKPTTLVTALPPPLPPTTQISRLANRSTEI
jgi:hypothetical protein